MGKKGRFKMKTQKFAAASAVAAMSVISLATAQGDFSNVEIKTTSLGGGVFMLEGAGGNIGLSIGADGAFVIDDQFAPLNDKIMEAIREVTDGEVEFVLNTHFHGDHTGGNEAFGKAGAHIVAHDNVRKRLIEGRTRSDGTVTPSAPKDALPVITFSHSMSFHWNAHDIRVWHPETAHTDGDAIIFFKDLNIVHMGDVFFNTGGYIYIDVDSGGGIDGAIAAQEKALSKIDDDTQIIPGHGPVATRADLQESIDLLKGIRARVQALIDNGLSEEDVVAADPLADLNPRWGGGFVNGEFMTRTAYRSLAGK